MPLVYRQRFTPRRGEPEGYAGELLHVAVDGVFATLQRDARGTWRGRVLVELGRVVQGVKQPAHLSGVTFSFPKGVGEGAAIAGAEIEIGCAVRAAAHGWRTWWRALPPNCPEPQPLHAP